MNQFSTAKDAIQHVIFSATSRFHWVFLPFVMEIQADFGIDTNAKIIVHYAPLVHFVTGKQLIGLIVLSQKICLLTEVGSSP